MEAPQLTASRPEERQAPTIHVTIGRVEVRAATPAATAPSAPRRQPAVLSLDEYLKQRGSGG
jgi:hypothetical protein